MAKQKKTPTNGLRLLHPPQEVQSTPTDLLRLAIESNLDMDKLERLMKMQEQWEDRKRQKAYFEAFGKFQSIMPDLIKNKSVKFEHRDGGGKTEYMYQELGNIASHIRQPLADTGLSYRWDQSEDQKVITVVCIISHVEGHQERSQPLSGAYDDSGKKNLIQQKASTITYLRRYTLTGMLGLSTMERDDDGKGGQKATPEPQRTAITAVQASSVLKRIIASKDLKEAERMLEEAAKHFTMNDDQWKTLEIAVNAKRTKETVAS